MWENQDIQILVSVHYFLANAGFKSASAALYKECVEKNIGCLPPKNFPETELDLMLSSVLSRKENISNSNATVSFHLCYGFLYCIFGLLIMSTGGAATVA
jgi:hypothetical protein